MLSKLIIEQNEEGKNFKSLCIVIENDKCTFGNWMEGKVDVKKKDVEKSQLIMKQDLDEYVSDFDLNLCAKKITFDGRLMPQVLEIKTDTESYCPNIALECSLEKVKENNAKIMENIQKLNRTLNYTKKKKMIDISSTKSLCSYPCDVCGTTFVYETGLRRHYIMRHANLDKHPRWQIVWTCTECFQIWPHREFALKHSKLCCKNENNDNIREIKTSLLLQCEYCEKVYTSIPRLQKHSKTHLSDKNYECNACSITFDNYKKAEQHWLLCPWLLMCYKFSLPKMLLCNICDRKFKNYDHLYNHRYKMAHLSSKTSNENKPNTVVYQCESCSQCFQGILQLTTHRNQSHGWLQLSSLL